MYSLKVRGTADSDSAAKDLAEASIQDKPEDKPDDAKVADALDFSAGNPRVEHVTGVIHLYRSIPKDRQETPQATLPEGRSERLCVLAIPADMGVSDFCQFLGGYLPHVRHMRVVRRERNKCVYSVLLRFDKLSSAESFYVDYNGKPYSSLEPEVICRLVWVKDVEFSPTQPAPSTDTASPTTAAPFDGQVELPTCPVCLERLDEHVSGVVTTVCNHRFHNECLQRWGDTSCPVCRYGQSVSVCYSTKRCLHTSQLPRYCQHPGTTSHCTSCGTSQDVWICLICGHVGCGRYKAAHAVDHWQESGHCYALELETQRVWDYVGDGYVHRLIQSKTDGKLVAVPSPATGSHSGGGGGGSRAERCSGNDAAHGHGMDDKEWVSKGELEEALLASKLDAVAQEYNHLLVTQLESQRQYYEGMLARALSGVEQQAAGARADLSKATSEAQSLHATAHREVELRKNAEKKLADAKAANVELKRECDFLRQLNTQLLSNQQALRDQLAAAKSSTEKDAAKMTDLEEQVRDLMLFLDTQRMIEQDGELKEGSIVGVQQPAESSRARRRGGRK